MANDQQKYDTYGNPFWYDQAAGVTKPGLDPRLKKESASKGMTLSGDPRMASGQQQGIERGRAAYGQTQEETGKQTQDIIRRRREQLDSKDPASTSIRQGRNRQLAMSKARGGTEGQQAQITRGAEQDIGSSEYQRQQKSLDKYQKLIGNVLGGQTELEMGFAGLEKSGEYIPPPRQTGGGLFDTIICGELARQGYMSDALLEKDREYGAFIRRTDPFVYSGYLILALPIVLEMRKSDNFSAIVSIPTLKWANHMAGNKNIVGGLMNLFGKPLCRLVGWIQFKMEVYDAKI